MTELAADAVVLAIGQRAELSQHSAAFLGSDPDLVPLRSRDRFNVVFSSSFKRGA